MSRIRDIIRSWTDRKAAKGRSLSTDGTSLISYGWYEIGRFEGADCYVRHRLETYSRTTSKHCGMMRRALESCRHAWIPVRGYGNGRMGEPDWKIIKAQRYLLGRPAYCRYGVRQDARLPGLRIALAVQKTRRLVFLKDLDVEALKATCSVQADCHRTYTILGTSCYSRKGVEFLEFQLPVDALDPEDPLKPSTAIIVEHLPKDHRWILRLLPPEECREILGV